MYRKTRPDRLAITLLERAGHQTPVNLDENAIELRGVVLPNIQQQQIFGSHSSIHEDVVIFNSDAGSDRANFDESN